MSKEYCPICEKITKHEIKKYRMPDEHGITLKRERKVKICRECGSQKTVE
jgi:ribosomal protein L44E